MSTDCSTTNLHYSVHQTICAFYIYLLKVMHIFTQLLKARGFTLSLGYNHKTGRTATTIIYIGTYQVDKTLHSALMAPYTLARIKVRHLATFFYLQKQTNKITLINLDVCVAKSSGKKQTQTFIVADLLKIKVPNFSSSYSCRLLSYWACLQATGTPWKLLNDKDYSLCVCVCVCVMARTFRAHTPTHTITHLPPHTHTHNLKSQLKQI